MRKKPDTYNFKLHTKMKSTTTAFSERAVGNPIGYEWNADEVSRAHSWNHFRRHQLHRYSVASQSARQAVAQSRRPPLGAMLPFMAHSQEPGGSKAVVGWSGGVVRLGTEGRKELMNERAGICDDEGGEEECDCGGCAWG